MSIITCDNISLAYDNRNVLTDVTFDIKQGEYFCIVGVNGSGKSTLIKALLGLKKINKGTISFDSSLRPNEIGYLPQQTEVQKDFPATVFEIVLSGCINSKNFRFFYSKKDKERAGHFIEKLGLGEISKKSYRELSGGQQQRVLLARALCATKRVILLDEPVTGLDPLVTIDLYEQVYSINKNEKITVIMVSHDVKSAVKYADTILHLDNRLKFFGGKDEYAKSDIGKSFLGGEEVV